MSTTLTKSTNGFADFELAPELQRGIADAGFLEPRPIQRRTIPAALEGRDILGLAQTGTGKTAAFALPVLERVLTSTSRRREPQVLVVAPTRELASQIGEEILLLARHTDIRVATLFGGVSFGKQRTALSKCPEILVACPGRLLDLHGRGEVRLDRITTLVLDEADHMFDMGFLPEVRRILEALPARRQNLLFSATMPPEIRRLANRLLSAPHVVELDHRKPIETIAHTLFPVDADRKLALLEHVLSEDGFVSAIVFTRTKHRARRIARQLDSSGHHAVALQGNMSQNQRERAMEGFRTRQFQILVATDIAARGIDVEQVSHVVNFDMPTTPDAYTHRIGRTGRSERQGRAYTFVTPDDHELVRAVQRRLGTSIRQDLIDGFGGAVVPSDDRPARRPAPRKLQGRGAALRRRRRLPGAGNGRGSGSTSARPRRSSAR